MKHQENEMYLVHVSKILLMSTVQCNKTVITAVLNKVHHEKKNYCTLSYQPAVVIYQIFSSTGSLSTETQSEPPCSSTLSYIKDLIYLPSEPQSEDMPGQLKVNHCGQIIAVTCGSITDLDL